MSKWKAEETKAVSDKLELRVGGQYRTAGGWRAVIVAVASNGNMQVWHSSDNIAICHYPGGLASPSGRVNSRDLVSEWREPRRVTVEGWVNVYENRVCTNVFFETKEDADTYVNRAFPRIACVHFSREVEEGEGL